MLVLSPISRGASSRYCYFAHQDKVSYKIAPGSYTVPIISRISFPATVTLDVNPFIDLPINSTDASRGPNISENNASTLETIRTNITAASISPRPSSFAVVVEPYPFQEQFKDFWSAYGDIISLIGGGFAAGLSALLIDRFRGRSRNKSRKIDDYSE